MDREILLIFRKMINWQKQCNYHFEIKNTKLEIQLLRTYKKWNYWCKFFQWYIACDNDQVK